MCVVLCLCHVSRDGLRDVMRLLLRCGNFMNHGTAMGNAAGYRAAEAFKQACNTRSNDGKETLLHYITLCLVRAGERGKQGLRFPEGMSSLDDAAKVCAAAVSEQVSLLRSGLAHAERELLSARENDPHRAVLSASMPSSRSRIQALVHLMERSDRKVEALKKRFSFRQTVPQVQIPIYIYIIYKHLKAYTLQWHPGTQHVA